MRALILIALLGLSGCATIDWNPLPDESYTTSHKVLLASYTVANVVDAKQTIYALEGCNGKCEGLYQEANPFFGKNPSRAKVIGAKLAVGYGIAVAIKNIRPQDRTLPLWGMFLIQSAVVSSNYNKPMIGFGFDF